MNALNVAEYTHSLGLQAKTASALMAKAPAAIKNKALKALARLLRENVAALQVDNAKDLERAVANGLAGPMVDRLKLTPKVLETCAEGCEQLAAMPDIIGEILGMKQQPSGIRVGQMRVPIGVFGMIYESRPNVTIEAASLSIKSGNACILRGGSEAIDSNKALAKLVQQALAEAVAATGKPIVVLLSNGRAMALPPVVRDARAILVTWFLGVQTGHAIADVLFGDFNPSGRLPVSFPQAAGQVPYYYAHKRTGRPLPSDAPGTAFKTRYIEASNEALYPFGFGLGFAPVRYDGVALDSERLPMADGTLRVRATVTNTGQREAEEVVQLYIAQRTASVTRPVRELKDFRKLRIAPGASVQVEFALRAADLAFIGRDLRPTVEPGDFDLWVSPSAVGGLHARFALVR